MAHLYAREVADHTDALRQHFFERAEPLLGQLLDSFYLLRQVCVFNDNIEVVLKRTVEQRLYVVRVGLSS